MRTLWRYLQVKDNREMLAFVCGGLAAVVSASWVAYTHFAHNQSDAASVAVSAPGGVAAQTITGSVISVGRVSPASTAADQAK